MARHSVSQLLPYQRIEEHFADQFGIPLSAGSIYNFNNEVYQTPVSVCP